MLWILKKTQDLRIEFDLLFRGLEITSGGQRIHDYDEQVAKMKAQGLNPDDFKYYLEAHKYGLPPHGGLGIGLERLVRKLLMLRISEHAVCSREILIDFLPSNKNPCFSRDFLIFIINACSGFSDLSYELSELQMLGWF